MTAQRISRAIAGVAIGALALTLTAPATTSATTQTETPTSYRLLGGSIFPEGIAVYGEYYYVNGYARHDIYRGELSQPTAQVFIPGPRGPGDFRGGGIKATSTRLIAAGLHLDAGIVSVYDRRSGSFVARFSGGPASHVNDVAIAPNGDAYITNSYDPVLYRIPAAALQTLQTGEQTLPVFLSWNGTPFEYLPGLNANGIVATPNGQFLLVVSYTSGQLFRVRLSDRVVTEVDLGGTSLVSGDGMVLTDAGTVYVVLAETNEVVTVQLNADYTHGELVSRTADPSFQTPTTAAIADERLLVVNSQFFGPGKQPWTVSSIPLP